MRKRASFLDFGELGRVVFLALLFFCCSTSAQAQPDSRYSILDTRGSSRTDPPTADFDRNPALLGRVSKTSVDTSIDNLKRKGILSCLISAGFNGEINA